MGRGSYMFETHVRAESRHYPGVFVMNSLCEFPYFFAGLELSASSDGRLICEPQTDIEPFQVFSSKLYQTHSASSFVIILRFSSSTQSMCWKSA